MAAERDPLLVVTGTDLALYPGGGAAPVIEPYRLASRGFKELAAISHLGPALATLARLRELAADATARTTAGAPTRPACTSPPRRPARPTRHRCGATRSRSARSPGREERIAAMIDYSCRLTERFLERALDDPATSPWRRSAATTSRARPADGDLPVPFNRVMIATFYLTGMDIAHRLITWLDAVGIDWDAGDGDLRRPGRAANRRRHPGVAQHRRRCPRRLAGAARPRAGVHRAARPRLPAVRPGGEPDRLAGRSALEDGYRRLWAGLRATSELAGGMFQGYPRFAAPSAEPASHRPRHRQRRRQACPEGPR